MLTSRYRQETKWKPRRAGKTYLGSRKSRKIGVKLRQFSPTGILKGKVEVEKKRAKIQSLQGQEKEKGKGKGREEKEKEKNLPR